MKHKTMFLFLVMIAAVILLAACGGGENTPDSAVGADGVPVLMVGEKSYTAAELEGMAQVEASFKGVSYVGVPAAELLADAGYDLASVRAIKAVAADGYSVNYEPDVLSPADVIVAYAQVDGALSADDGDFRMVLPDQEGNMNLRMMVEMQVVE
ncbi:MAG TPA: molybdopterin-dependent oxidoreductase [Anaerolineales bacterium]|nr:molybdopterin-dependent oxidoreductase [Anaerolineales bacterium]